MKRDMNLARTILLQIEADPAATGAVIRDFRIEGRPDEEVSYHVRLLNEAGLIEAKDLSNLSSGLVWRPKRLTWAGHEFLDAARNPGLWRKANTIIKEKGLGATFDVLKAVLVKLAVDLATGG